MLAGGIEKERMLNFKEAEIYESLYRRFSSLFNIKTIQIIFTIEIHIQWTYMHIYICGSF